MGDRGALVSDAGAAAFARPDGFTVPGNRWDLLTGVRPTTLPQVSVIIVHYRQQAQLERTLRALDRQRYPKQLIEIIVVDDGSPEPPTVPSGVKLLVQPDRGFRLAAARNRGATAAHGSVLCFLDADTAPEPGYLAALTRLPSLAPEAVTVGLRRHADFSNISADAAVESTAPARELPAPVWLAEAYARSQNLLHADERSYRYLIGAVLCCSREFFAELGGFDESFTEYGGEDWEFGYRAWLSGAIVAHVPQAVAWHDGADWSGRVEATLRRQHGKNLETRRLATAIPLAGSTGHALRTGTPDLLFQLGACSDASAAFLCVDTLLSAMPQSGVSVPAEFAAVFHVDSRVVAPAPAHPRIVVDVPAAIRVDPAALRAALARFDAEQLGSLRVTTAGGIRLLTVHSARASARRLRWNRDDLFLDKTIAVRWARPLSPEPDLEAYFGGWG